VSHPAGRRKGRKKRGQEPAEKVLPYSDLWDKRKRKLVARGKTSFLILTMDLSSLNLETN
jgi:hypothetical protein